MLGCQTLCILDIRPLSDTWFVNNFSLFLDFFFLLSSQCPLLHKSLILMKSNLLFLLLLMLLASYLRIHWQIQGFIDNLRGYIVFIHWWMFELFLPFAVVDSAAVNIYVQEFVFSSFGFIPWSGIARWHSNSMLHFLRNCQIFFHSCWPLMFPTAVY